VWKAYGVRIEVQTSTGIVSHNNVLYFIDAKGRLRLRATPFADENSNGTFSLARGTETRFASGIASSVESLLQPDGSP
jgi:cytochrome oxidase Cu insertion factor (SCO1/SenC/PrrC family)